MISDSTADFSDPRGGSGTIHGGEGDDNISANAGADRVYGDDGRDVLDGAAGANIMHGGDGNDSLGTNYFDDSEVYYGGAGDDVLERSYIGVVSADGVAASDTFHGGSGDDGFIIEGISRGGDIVYAGAGKDGIVLGPPVAGSGKHRIYCGSGYDSVYYYNQSLQGIVTHDCEKVTRFG